MDISKHSTGAVLPASSPLDRLGIDLLLLILDHVPNSDLHSLRLTCRRLCHLSTPRLFRRIRFALHRDYVKPLVEILRHEGLRHHVRELVYVTLYNYHPISGCALEHGHRSPYHLERYHYSSNKTSEVESHEKILATLSLLPNVTKVILSNKVLSAKDSETDYPGLLHMRRQPVDSSRNSGWGFGVRNFLVALILSGLRIQDISTLPGEQIEGVCRDTFASSDTLLSYIKYWKLGAGRNFMQNLRSIDFCIWTRDIGPITFVNWEFIYVTLAQARQLERLDLRLPFYRWHGQWGLSISYLLEQILWKNLQQITLRGFDCGKFKSVVKFIEHHKTLRLVNITMSQTYLELRAKFSHRVPSWEDLSIDEILKSAPVDSVSSDWELDKTDGLGYIRLEIRDHDRIRPGHPVTIRLNWECCVIPVSGDMLRVGTYVN